jgi:hypothetical protein
LLEYGVTTLDPISGARLLQTTIYHWHPSLFKVCPFRILTNLNSFFIEIILEKARTNLQRSLR